MPKEETYLKVSSSVHPFSGHCSFSHANFFQVFICCDFPLLFCATHTMFIIQPHMKDSEANNRVVLFVLGGYSKAVALLSSISSRLFG